MYPQTTQQSDSFSPYLQQAQQIYGQLGGESSPQNIVSLASQLQKQGQVSATAQQGIDKLNAAKQIINDYYTLYQKTKPIGFAPLATVLGKGKRALSKAGLSQSTKLLEDLQAGTITKIARAMGETGPLSDYDIKRYMTYLPNVEDTPEQAKKKIEFIMSQLSATQSNIGAIGTQTAESGFDPYATEQSQGFDTSMFGY